MLDNPESAGAAVEPAGTPNPEVSRQQPDSPPSGSQSVDEIVKLVLSHPDYQKDKQSVKDKRIAEIQTSLGEQDERLARLAKHLGVDPSKVAEAQRELDVEDMVQAYRDGKLVPRVSDPNPLGSGNTDLTKAVTAILEKSNLSPTDPAVSSFLQGVEANDVPTVLAEVARFAVEQANKPRAGVADVPSQPVGSAPVVDLQQSYTDEMLAARGNRTLLNAIKEKYREAGLDVDRIGFNV